MPLEIGETPGNGRPWGDIFKVETPQLDQATQQLQAQYAARQAFQQKTAANTDELLNKELANVRSVDAPQVFDAYSKWKTLATNMIGNQALQRNPKAYNAAQMEANAAYGQAMALINKSTTLNTFGKQLATDRNTPGKSNLYADDFGDKASTFWKTPMDKLDQTPMGDLSNLDTYRYKGMNNVNFGDMEKKAAGTASPKYQKEEQISPLQKNVTPYSFGNTPAQFQSSLRGEYASNPATYRAASAAWESIPQTEKDRVDQLYAQIPSEKWQQMGLQGPQAISPTNPQDPADNLAAYKAKLYAINTNPSVGAAKSVIDQGAKMNLQEQERLRTVGVQHVNRMAEIAFRYANSKDMVDYKLRKTDPEGTTPTVDAISTLLEHPGQLYNGKSAAQLSQDVLSNWNSQGNTANTQSKLTVVPSFTNPNIKGYTDFANSALTAVGNAYNSVPTKSVPWSTINEEIKNPATSPQRVKELLVGAYNAINEYSGSPVRFTTQDLDKSVPLLHQKTDVFSSGNRNTYQVVKTGTPEFQNVVNEKRNAVLGSKKPVIQGQPEKEPGAGGTETHEIKISTGTKKIEGW